MSGLDFLVRLRENAPQAAVVMLTRLASEPGAIACLRAGAQDYIVMDRITASSLKHSIDQATRSVAQDRQLHHKQIRLTRSLGEQEVLLKEVQHRVKNNLQVIASLLRMQADSSSDARLKAALQESLNRVESMALIHEQLYESNDLRAVDLVEHATVLMTNLFHAYGADPARITSRIAFGQSRGNTLLLGVDLAIPAGLILNELISNALKHAFPGDAAGNILVGGGVHKGEVELYVQDNGAGLPKKFDISKPNGTLGLRIVTILTRQLKGTLSVEQGSPGSTFRLRFPLQEKTCRQPARLMKAKVAHNAN
jgi:two-component sensor histidine kinase